MISRLQNLSNLSGWRFLVQEGSIIGRCGLSDRDIEVDLNGFDRLKSEETITTQVFAYVSFARLNPIHNLIREALPKRQGVCGDFDVHERKTFLTHFSSNWRSELEELLKQIESWSATLDLDSSVSRFAAHRPDGPSVPQINHLVALVYLGDSTTLEEYARAFAKGARLNFVPLITREAIQTALAASFDYFVEGQTQAEPDAAPNSRPPQQSPSSPQVQSSDSQRTSSPGGCG